MLQIAENKDLRISGLDSDRLSAVLEILKQNGLSNRTLRVYEVPKDNLIEFVTTRSGRNSYDVFPEDQYRRLDLENVTGTDD